MTETQNPYKPPTATLEMSPSADLPLGEHRLSRYARYCSWSFFVTIIGGSLIGTPPLLIVLFYIPGLLAIFFVVSAVIAVRKAPNRLTHVRPSAWILSIQAFIFASLLVAALASGYLYARTKAQQKRHTQSQGVASSIDLSPQPRTPV
jgi:hypothetical protein